MRKGARRGESLEEVEYEGPVRRRTASKDRINMISETKRMHSPVGRDPAMKRIGARRDEEFVGLPAKQTKKMRRYADSSFEEIGTNPKRPRKRAAGGHWIQKAIKHPGALHEELHVPKGQKIPHSKIVKATHARSPLERRRANLALTLEKMHKR